MSNKSQKSDQQKNIAEHFEGLEMKELIGGPLFQAYKAQEELADASYEFLNEVGFSSSDCKK